MYNFGGKVDSPSANTSSDSTFIPKTLSKSEQTYDFYQNIAQTYGTKIGD